MLATGIALEIRKTNEYVGTFSHLDEWESVGSCDVLDMETTYLDTSDPCDPCNITLEVQVTAKDGTTDDDIIKAIKHSFSNSGCHHEHDCCGCISTYVQDVKKTSPNHFTVTQHNSRNY